MYALFAAIDCFIQCGIRESAGLQLGPSEVNIWSWICVVILLGFYPAIADTFEKAVDFPQPDGHFSG